MQAAETNGHEQSPLLEVKDLRVEFLSGDKWVRAVDGVNWSVSRGETVAILGESGSGKTVSSLAVAGILPCPPARIPSGSLMFDGSDLLEMSLRARRRRINGDRIAMIFQDALDALNPSYRVGWQISEAYRIKRGTSRKAAAQRAIELLDRVRIPSAKQRARQYPHELSGGMRQRAVIAMAIALDPELLIADEPTTALDVTVQGEILELLAEIQDETNMGLVIISHDLGVVADVADRIVVMYAGGVVEQGPLKEVYEEPAHPYTKALLTSIPRLDRRVERAATIPGSPPTVSEVHEGCPFAPRCELVEDRCWTDPPELRPVSGSRRSACHFFERLVGDD